MTEQNTSVEAPKRPQFLTVLCILTFIGSGIGVITSIMSYFAAKAAGAIAQGFSEGMNKLADGQGGQQMDAAMASANASINATVKWGATVAIIGIIGALICLFGAIMMWKQKKTGFYIYLIGEVAPAIASIALLGFGLLGGMGIAMSLVFPIAFIIMYGLNLKHMS